MFGCARIAASEHNVSGMFEKFYEAATGKDVAKATTILINISKSEILTAKHLIELIVMTKKLTEAEIDHVDIVQLLDGVRKNFTRIYGPN